MQFTLPYLRREAWSDKGTDDPLNTILTMFWAIRQGDEAKLGRWFARTYASHELARFDPFQAMIHNPWHSELTLPKRDWNQTVGVQV